jgi:pSer/pThr/pTyr-binding forkhead associated (FHA) protein
MEIELDRLLDETVHPAAAPAVFLMVMSGPEDGRFFPLAKDTSQIGRLDTNEIPLALDPVVSRAHALVTREGDRYFISDLGSKFGTVIDGRSVGPRERVELRHGSTIVIGETALEFRRTTGGEAGKQ